MKNQDLKQGQTRRRVGTQDSGVEGEIGHHKYTAYFKGWISEHTVFLELHYILYVERNNENMKL